MDEKNLNTSENSNNDVELFRTEPDNETEGEHTETSLDVTPLEDTSEKTPLPGKRVVPNGNDDDLFIPEVDPDAEPIQLTDSSGTVTPPRRSKKPLLVAGIIIVLLAAVYLAGSFYFKTHFYPGAAINGFDVGWKSASDVESLFSGTISDRNLTLKTVDGTSETISADQVNMEYHADGTVEKDLATQNPFAWPVEMFSSQFKNMTATFTCDETALNTAISQLNAVSGGNVVKMQNAKPVIENGSVTVTPEVNGNELDTAKLTAAVKDAIIKGEDTLDLSEAGCYKQPAYTTESPEVKATAEAMEKALQTKITYTFGSTKKETVDSATFAPWISVDDNMVMQINSDQANAYTDTLAEKYDTVGTTRTFTTSLGSTTTVSGGNYGWEIDTEGEAAKLIEDIKAGKVESREPVWYQTAASHDGNDFGNTYVEISIASQHMWMYKNGQQIVSTPIVTGTAGQYDTPTGTYALMYKALNVTLKGEGYASPVTYWMPFNGDIGIHDASWRSQYGGSIYLTNGSHGCVNTPYAQAGIIYDNISDGDPVIVW